MVAQAASLHITETMSWEQLASKQEYSIPGVYSSQVPTFTIAQLAAAQELLTVSAKMAEERAKTEPEVEAKPVKTRSPGETAKPTGSKPVAKPATGKKK